MTTNRHCEVATDSGTCQTRPQPGFQFFACSDMKLHIQKKLETLTSELFSQSSQPLHFQVCRYFAFRFSSLKKPRISSEKLVDIPLGLVDIACHHFHFADHMSEISCIQYNIEFLVRDVTAPIRGEVAKRLQAEVLIFTDGTRVRNVLGYDATNLREVGLDGE
jgi:hypothetical protein